MGFRKMKAALSREQILDALGLEEKRSARARTLETIGAFSVGLVVGASAALLLAPTSGAELRRRIVELVREKGPWAAHEDGDETRSHVDEERRAEAAI